MSFNPESYIYLPLLPLSALWERGLTGVGIRTFHPHPNPLPEGEGVCWLSFNPESYIYLPLSALRVVDAPRRVVDALWRERGFLVP